ncbi:unnamed protein product [marine sediment metagenome]|uniref:Uncharacterized protein n=1 Tax=marine sediment metagenome TaxID=412755 RepID=X1FL15_9ZZZZ
MLIIKELIIIVSVMWTVLSVFFGLFWCALNNDKIINFLRKRMTMDKKTSI